MSKIRNSLGVLVLPVVYESLSFDQYKQRYGIDLDEIFTLSADEETIVRASCTKALYLSFGGVSSPYQNPVVPALIAKDGETSKLIVFYPSFAIDMVGNTIEITSFQGIRVSVEDREIEYCEI